MLGVKHIYHFPQTGSSQVAVKNHLDNFSFIFYDFKGYGKALMEHSFRQAAGLGYDVIVIFGSPVNYVSSGFKSCKKFNVCLDNGKFPATMMVKELKDGALDGRRWFYRDSPVMAIDEQIAQAYDSTLEPMEKKYLPSQDEFYIMSHSFVEDDEK